MNPILIVEDCPINRFFLEKGLKNYGFSVVTTCNGQEALDWLRMNRAELVLMDVQMPVLDGLDATRLIRDTEDGAAERLPIIAVTACITEHERQRCLKAGMDTVLPKPVVLAELIELVQTTVLEKKKNCDSDFKSNMAANA